GVALKKNDPPGAHPEPGPRGLAGGGPPPPGRGGGGPGGRRSAGGQGEPPGIGQEGGVRRGSPAGGEAGSAGGGSVAREHAALEGSGPIIESRLDVGRGPVATMLVQRGTLRVGDSIVAGDAWGRVRALYNYRGEKVEQASPGTPVEILGFDHPPPAGEFSRV